MSRLTRNAIAVALLGLTWFVSGSHGDKTERVEDQTKSLPDFEEHTETLGERRTRVEEIWEFDTLMIFAVVVGFLIGLIAVLILVLIVRHTCRKQRAARAKQRMLNREPLRLDLQVYRADPYDVNRTMSGIPTITDIWREMQVRPASPSLAEKTPATLPYKEQGPGPYTSTASP